MKKHLSTAILTLFLIFPGTIHAKYWSEVKCYLISISENTRHLHGKEVYGKGSGKTEEEATKAAKKDINDNHVPQGMQAKHCHEINKFKQ